MDASVAFGHHCNTNYYNNISLTTYSQKTSNLKGVRKHSIVNKVLSVKSSFNLISVLIPSNEFHRWSYREQSYTSSKRRWNSSWFSTLLLMPFSFHSLEIGRSQIQSNRLCRQPYFALIGCYDLRNIPYDIEKMFPLLFKYQNDCWSLWCNLIMLTCCTDQVPL